VVSRKVPTFPNLAKFNMDKNVSIVVVDKRHYRAIARENWGLTKEQMKGMHVHHRIPKSKGGTDDPSNLYVCSAWFHQKVWHAKDSYNSLIPYAVEGSKKGSKAVHAEKDESGKSLHAVKMGKLTHRVKTKEGKSQRALDNNKVLHSEKNREGKSSHASKMGKKTHERKNESGKSIHAIEHNKSVHSEKDEKGRSLVAMKTNNQTWESTIDGYRNNAGAVASHNRKMGWDPKARVRVG
jgi:hypothetical protein